MADPGPSDASGRSPDPPASSPPRRGRRAARRAFAASLVIALLAVGAVAALGSEALLRWVIDRATAASGGALAVTAPAGSLLREVRVGRITWQDDATGSITADDVAVGLDWRALATATLRLRHLSAARVEVVSPPSDAAAAPPASLAPPLPIDLAAVRIGELVVRRAGPDDAIRLTDISASARWSRGAWTVDEVSLRGDFGALRAGGTLGGAPPFALSARALLETQVLGEAVAVDASADGELASVDVRARLVLRDASAIARLRIAPFAAQPLVAIDATIAALDLARFDPSLPVTRIEGRIRADTVGAASSPSSPHPGTVLPQLAGSVELRNALPGTIDARRLPLASVGTRFGFDGERLTLEGLAIEGPAGRLAGDASLRVPADLAWPADGLPDFRLGLATESLDLRAVHAGLRRTALRGRVSVAPEGRALGIDARLADGGLALEGRARWADAMVAIERATLQANDGVATVSGTAGTAAPFRFDLAGTIARLDPSRFAELPPGLLNGRFAVRGEAGSRPTATLSATLADSRLRGLPLAGSAAATWSPERVRDAQASLRLGGTALTARGALGAAGDRLAVVVDATRLGELDPRLAGRARLEAELRDALVLPAVTATLRGRDLAVGDRFGARALELRTELAQPAALRELLARLRTGSVPVAGTGSGPGAGAGTRGGTGTGGETGEGARKGAAKSAGAGAGGGAGAAAAGAGPGVATGAGSPPPLAPALRVALQVDALQAAGQRVDELRAEFEGDADRHGLDLRVRSVPRDRLPALEAAARIEGGLERGGVARWRGRLVALSQAAAPTVTLLEPTELALSPGAIDVGPARIRIDGADGALLTLGGASWADGRGRLEATVAGAPLRWLAAVLPDRGLRVADAGALRLGARVDLAGAPGPGGDLRGRIELHRESGDLLVDVPAQGGGTEVLRAGLSALQARVELGDGRMSATAAMRGAAFGVLTGEARAPLAWTAAGGLDTTVPLEGRAELDMPSLAFTRTLTGETWRFDGALRGRLALSGTLAAPRANGRLEGSDLVAEQRELGLKLVDGTLEATLRDNTIDVEVLRFSSGAGTVTLTGALRPDERSEAVVVLDRMPAPLGAGQRLVLSGEARASFEANVLRLRGALRADEGVIEITANNAPALSKDVLVVRDASEAASARALAQRRAAQSGPAAEVDPEAGRGFRVSANLQIDLGDRLRVVGAGVDARLVGRLTLRGRLPESPRLTGTVRIAQGTYTGFGQKLEIERGTLVFSGPVDNPAIDIVAYRRYLPVEAGVALTGTARTPRLALVSKPDVPDPDKLSWLVLGTGADTARSGGQNAALQTAAATLLAAADPNASGPGFASTFGLDVLSIRTSQAGSTGEGGSAAASAQDSVVTLGKRLSERLFVSYEQSLRGLQNLLRLQYEITERLSVRARAGTQNGVDLLWIWRYD